MSGRGGTYRGPQGQQLYGDGREVDPVTRRTKEMTRLEELVEIEVATPGPWVWADLKTLRDLLAVAEAAREWSESLSPCEMVMPWCAECKLRAALARLLEQVKEGE